MVIVWLDDILISGKPEDHIDNLADVFCPISKNQYVKLSKCVLMAPSVTYNGYLVDKNGIHPCSEKIDDIKIKKNYSIFPSILYR